MKICLVLKGDFNKLPPIISLCEHLCDIGYELTIICDRISCFSREHFKQRGVDIRELESIFPYLGKAGTAITWLNFRRKAWLELQRVGANLIWVGSADTALALGTNLLSTRFVIHIHELYDQFPIYRNGLKKFVQAAVGVLVSEETRAHIFRSWYQLRETPIVLPNKPYGHPRKRRLPITDAAAAEAFSKIPHGTKIVFYQGGVSERRDLKPIARAIEELGTPWALAVQCPIVDNEYYKDFFANYKFYYIPYIQAPLHLEVTSNVDFGLLTYTHISMNNEFCAPNKVWEYSGFGLPMIANDVLGLKNTVERFNAGICMNLDLLSLSDLKNNLRFLLERENEFGKNAELLYQSCDNVAVLRNALKRWEHL